MLDFTSISSRAQEINQVLKQQEYERTRSHGNDLLGGLAAGAATFFGMPWLASTLTGLGGAWAGLGQALELSGVTSGAGQAMSTISAAKNAYETGKVGDAVLGQATGGLETGYKALAARQLEERLKAPKIEEHNKKVDEFLKTNPDYREGIPDVAGVKTVVKGTFDQDQLELKERKQALQIKALALSNALKEQKLDADSKKDQEKKNKLLAEAGKYGDKKLVAIEKDKKLSNAEKVAVQATYASWYLENALGYKPGAVKEDGKFLNLFGSRNWTYDSKLANKGKGGKTEKLKNKFGDVKDVPIEYVNDYLKSGDWVR